MGKLRRRALDGILDVNPRMCALLGYDPEALLAPGTPELAAAEAKGSEGQVAGYSSHNRELALLNKLVAASAIDPEPDTTLETACRELVEAFEVAYAAVVLLNEEKTEALVVAEYQADGVPARLNESIPVEGNPFFQYLLTHKAPLVVEGSHHDSHPWPADRDDPVAIHEVSLSLLALPLTIDGEVVGSLCLDAIQPRHFSAGEVSLAWSVAGQVSAALTRAQLLQNERRLVTAIEQITEAVVMMDAQGIVLYVNPAFERITGYSQAEVLGQTLDILRSDKQDEAFFQAMWATVRAGKVWQGRIVNKRKDGTLYADDTTITPVRNEQGDILNYVEVKRDVTREQRLEEQYHQLQKMQAIGQLTAGIAHDFNNMLTAINGFAELAYFESSADDSTRELVGKILHAGRRATDLVRQLLAFSRKQIIEPRILNLNKVVGDIENMLQRIIGENIELHTSLAPDLWQVEADPSQIEQLVLNLAVNARDAMPHGGQLFIKTANVVLDQDYVAQHLDMQLGEHVMLAVSDTGVGMSKEVQAHIFEPFFTTKGSGKGTGLGLATVYGIVKQSGGHIWVYSEEGFGTTFKIYLPRAGSVTPAETDTKLDEKTPSGSETILLVEDDSQVRELARHALSGQGYQVLAAANGQQALQLAASYADPIHLLLTDVVLPGLGGKALAEQLALTRPHLSPLFMSGYLDETIERHGVLEPGIAFLQKPFSTMGLARKVRSVLDGPRQEEPA